MLMEKNMLQVYLLLILKKEKKGIIKTMKKSSIKSRLDIQKEIKNIVKEKKSYKREFFHLNNKKNNADREKTNTNAKKKKPRIIKMYTCTIEKKGTPCTSGFCDLWNL